MMATTSHLLVYIFLGHYQLSFTYESYYHVEQPSWYFHIPQFVEEDLLILSIK